MNQSQGESLFMQGKIDEAVVELQKEAKMGAPRAMYLIGLAVFAKATATSKPTKGKRSNGSRKVTRKAAHSAAFPS